VTKDKDRIKNRTYSQKHILTALVAISVLSKLLLASKGGQYFFVDEARFLNGHYLLASLADGDFQATLYRISTNYAHVFFIFFAALAEGIRFLYVDLVNQGDTPAYLLTETRAGIEVAALVLSFASSISIFLVYVIIRRFGGGKDQALAGAFLMVLSTTNYYYARHLLPYDCSIMLALIALYFGAHPEGKVRHSLLCGLFAGLATLTYNGYWILSIVVWLLHIMRSDEHYKKRIKKAILCAFAGVSPLIILQFISLSIGENFLRGEIEWLHASKGNQYGDLGLGWAVFFVYLWEAEHGILIVFIVGIIFSVRGWLANFSLRSLDHRMFGPFAALVIFLLLILLSDVAQVTVLYGRTIKQIVPFLCIACALPLTQLKNFLPRTKINLTIALLLVASIAQAAYNQSTCLNITFPSSFKAQVENQYGPVSRLSNLKGPNIDVFEHIDPGSEYILVNGQNLILPIHRQKAIPQGKVLLSVPHPYQYKPYQFIHFNYRERTILDNTDLSMKLLKKN
jgi:hypothetical protein